MAPPLIARNWALFLDVDGTLIDYVPRPDDAHLPLGLRKTLSVLLRELDGALALVSGRALEDVERLFAPLRLPVAGQHGAEARFSPEGATRVFVATSAALEAVIARLEALLADHSAILIERKGLSVAVHYRGAEDQRERLREFLVDAVARQGDELQLLDSHLCFDIKPRGTSKGLVVKRFMTQAPFEGRVPVFIGDDRTDEDGFAAALAMGGRAIRVGVAGISIAPERVTSPRDLCLWLERSATALAAH